MFAEHYLQNHAIRGKLIQEPPSGLLRFFVVIPAYAEPGIFEVLKSLRDTIPVQSSIEVFVVINFPEQEAFTNKEFSQNQYNELLNWCTQKSSASLRFYATFQPDLPRKHAGAGLARKIGMDEGIRRFNETGHEAGIILSLDADSPVSPNYFQVLENEFLNQAHIDGVTIGFAHPMTGNEFSEEVYQAITAYELHLRYLKHALQSVGYPYYYYTIGSAFGVRAKAYTMCGGMNKRQAGEDFYFLHKLFPDRTFTEINTCTVYPSPRPSHRVIFGTGATIQKYVQGSDKRVLTYHPKSFQPIGQLLETVKKHASEADVLLHLQVDDPMWKFLEMYDIHEKLQEISKNTSSADAFFKRFLKWFDGFKMVKYLNYVHQEFYEKIDVNDAVGIWVEMNSDKPLRLTNREYLLKFRMADKLGIPVLTILSQ